MTTAAFVWVSMMSSGGALLFVTVAEVWERWTKRK
jgi:hypothetical protein